MSFSTSAMTSTPMPSPGSSRSLWDIVLASVSGREIEPLRHEEAPTADGIIFDGADYGIAVTFVEWAGLEAERIEPDPDHIALATEGFDTRQQVRPHSLPAKLRRHE